MYKMLYYTNNKNSYVWCCDMPTLNIRKIERQVDLENFSCGNGSIDGLVRDCYFTTIIKQGTAYEVRLNDTIIGYYLISVAALKFEDIIIRASENKYAAIHIGFIAVDSRYQHKRYGKHVLEYIIAISKKLSRDLPIRFLFLNALKEKVPWYKERGFSLLNEAEMKNDKPTVNMFMDFLDISVVEEYLSRLN